MSAPFDGPVSTGDRFDLFDRTYEVRHVNPDGSWTALVDSRHLHSWVEVGATGFMEAFDADPLSDRDEKIGEDVGWPLGADPVDLVDGDGITEAGWTVLELLVGAPIEECPDHAAQRVVDVTHYVGFAGGACTAVRLGCGCAIVDESRDMAAAR